MSSTASTTKVNTKMAGDKKTTKKTETAPVVATTPAPVSAPAPTPAPKKAAAPKKVPAAKAEVTVPTVAATPSTPTVAVSSDVQLAALTEQLKTMSAEFSAKVREAVKGIQAAAVQAKREARDSKKKRKVDPATLSPEARAAWEARRANNAFLRQRPISDELAVFMGTTAGSKRSQTEVTKFIADYVKSHGCFDKDFKRRILPNAALATLLRVSDKDEVTYLNLQSFLKVHFKKE